MNHDTLVGDRAAQHSPFLLPSAGGRFRSKRTRGPGEVNLKSAGLLHPGLPLCTGAP